jgi:hypothetical protein
LPRTAIQWSGEEWDEYVSRLLIRKYHTAYQRVPAAHGGDLGIEGFSRDGRVYQCYAHQGQLRVADRYEKQRRKMTADIRKFVGNGTHICEIVGEMTIEEWVFVVPEHDSRHLNSHAAAKQELVREAGIACVSPDFRISIVTDDYFETERRELIAAGLGDLALQESEPSEDELQEWQGRNTPLVEEMERKLDKLHRLGVLTSDSVSSLQSKLIRDFVRGESVLETVRTDYPEIWEIFRRVKRTQEYKLEGASLLSESHLQRLRTAIEELEERITEAIPTLGDLERQWLTWSTVADWLMRCPLDFPETENS